MIARVAGINYIFVHFEGHHHRDTRTEFPCTASNEDECVTDASRDGESTGGVGKRSRARESERYRVAARERSARRGRVPVMSAGARKSSSGDERQNENKSTTDASRVGVHTDACGARSRLRAAERQSGCGSESMGKGNPLTRAGQREPSHDGRRDEARREQNGENGDDHGWARVTVGCRVPRGARV